MGGWRSVYIIRCDDASTVDALRHRDIRRSSFMGDFIYAVSDRGVTCHRLSDLTLTASVELQGSFNP